MNLHKGDVVAFEDVNGKEQTGVIARVDSGTVIVRLEGSGRAKEIPVTKIRSRTATDEVRG